MNIQGRSSTGTGNGRNGILRGVTPVSSARPRVGKDVSTDPPKENAFLGPANTILQALDHEQFLGLRQFIKRAHLVKDQYVYQQDDEIDLIYFPETAVVSDFQILEDGRTIEVGIIASEGAVGIASAFGSCRAANCTQVCVSGSALVIGRDIFERAVMSDPRLQRSIHAYLNAQVKQLSQRVVCNTFHSVEQRFCGWLLTLHRRSRRQSFTLTHEHVARVLGVHRPSVTCIAQALRDRELIDYGRARLEIRNRAGLEQIACRCSADHSSLQFAH